MKNLSSLASLALAMVVILFLFSCTPGKAQTRKDSGQKNSQDISSDLESNEFSNENSDIERGYNVKSGRGDEKKSVKKQPQEPVISDDDSAENSSGSENKNSREKFYQTGMASWYGREFQGKATASGEKFNMNKYTAAHKSLPFGTLLEVKNLDNGKIVKVRINDRGPYKGNRIIDLSYTSAKELGMLADGQALVGINILKKGADREASRKSMDLEAVSDEGDALPKVKSGRSADGFSVQAGAFYTKKNAENLKKKIESYVDGDVSVFSENGFYKVRIEGLDNKKKAERVKKTLGEKNINSYIVEQE